MARVTKINVGGTNYDIAHEGVLKNSGFEVVNSLPTTNLFEGREVRFNGKRYVYSSGWKEDGATANTMYEANLLWGGRNISNGVSPIDSSMMPELSSNMMAFPKPAGISIEYSRDGGVTWIDYEATDKQKVELFTKSTRLYCGNTELDNSTATVGFQLRITITPILCNVYINFNKIIMKISTTGSKNCWCTFKGLKSKEVVAGNEDDSYYDTFVDKAKINGYYNVLNFQDIRTAQGLSTYNNDLYYRVRIIFGYDDIYTGTPYKGLDLVELRFFGLGHHGIPSNLARYNHLYEYDWKQNALFPAKVESNEIINFNVNNIEPTQTGSVSKTSTWLWQYLVQGVNWLRANKFSGSYNDLTNTPNLATVATSGSYNDLTDKPTFSGSYNDLTDKPTLFSGSYDDLTDKPTLAAVATSGSYDDLTNTPTIPSSLEDLGGSVTTAQITDGSITNAKLANSSMSLNGTTVNLGDSAILPWYVDYNETDYPARIRDHWLQIYRNGVWANLMYLGDILPTQVGQITSLANLDWYNEQVSEYEVDSNTTTSILNGTTMPATVLFNCSAEQLTISLYPISGKQYGKGSLDSLISDLQGKGFSVFVENDLDAIIGSGSDYLVRIKISKVPTPKAIIECYVSR